MKPLSDIKDYSYSKQAFTQRKETRSKEASLKGRICFQKMSEES